MGLRIIHDTDTVTKEFDGDRLVLREAPRQRDVFRCEDLIRADIFDALEQLKATGYDPIAAAADPKEVEKARVAMEADVHENPKPLYGDDVRDLRLAALAVSLAVGDETFTGPDAVLAAYRDMDMASAERVDKAVADVWYAALPGEADTRG